MLETPPDDGIIARALGPNWDEPDGARVERILRAAERRVATRDVVRLGLGHIWQAVAIFCGSLLIAARGSERDSSPKETRDGR